MLGGNTPRMLPFQRLLTLGLTTATMTTLPAEMPRWTPSDTFFAPEAFQAVAADSHHIYAIASRVVAKYDRSTKTKIATSRGSAKHLNSGLLLNGKLYCAHSNYPQKPEISQIYQLDPASMTLSVFKDFGDYGGSLTWMLRRNNHWWVNFAYYGEDNHRTYLAKFDEQWNELNRWTYPPDVISKLGKYSLSGGVFLGQNLLVTGHDDPVIFVLRIPDQGDQLTYLRTESVPFFGQGFAIDPVTKGLVGIRRNRLQIIVTERDEPWPQNGD